MLHQVYFSIKEPFRLKLIRLLPGNSLKHLLHEGNHKGVLGDDHVPQSHISPAPV